MTTFREYREALSTGRAVERDVPALPTDAIRFQGERAGLVSRAASAVIDVLLVFAVVLATVAAFWMLSFIINPTNPADLGSLESASQAQRRIPEVLTMIVYGYVVNVLYWTVFWAASGRTVGNLIMGLRVIDRRGRSPGWIVSFLRALFCTAFPLGLVWAAFSRSNRSLQDVVLRTSVIYDWVVGIPWLRSDLKHAADDRSDSEAAHARGRHR
jgi:uncharacterized RDD family membrane protein YckC